MSKETPAKRKDPPSNASDPNDPVPSLDGVTFGELETAVKVLNSVAKLYPKQVADFKASPLRPFRKALAGCVELQQMSMYKGNEEEYFEERNRKRSVKRQKATERDLYRNHIEKTKLRQGRIEKLNALQDEGKDEEQSKLKLLVPDGHVDTPKLLTDEEHAESVKLPCFRSCYVCKVRYQDMHHFYDQLCPVCAALNWEKRHLTADLSNRIAVVTGSRVKIGYQVCLKLLRSQCTVVATTRFPNSALTNFRKEPDFGEFSDRLFVYGLDLRDVSGLEAFIRFLKLRYERTGIDILINNACQTIRRPAQYYRPMLQQETEIWKNADNVHKSCMADCIQYEKLRRRIVLDHEEVAASATGASRQSQMLPEPSQNDPKGGVLVKKPAAANELTRSRTTTAPFEVTGISHSAAMSQMIILPEDAGVNDDILPPGISDINGQQLDLRHTNSWLLKMEEVSTPELMECMFVNAIAPFVLNARLKPLMKTPTPHPDRFIINVSAMEGKVRDSYVCACVSPLRSFTATKPNATRIRTWPRRL